MRMTTRWAAYTGTLLVAITMTVPVQAQAEEPHWEFSEGYQYADASWTLAGRVAGRPGNAHSGSFNFEGDDDGVTAELLDWRCPAGVKPPTQIGSETDCKLKASIWIQQQQFINTYKFGKRLLHNRIRITVPVEDSLTGTTVDQEIFVRMRGLRPAERSVETYFVDSAELRFHHRTVNLARPAKFRGQLVWLNLKDPRIKFVQAEVRRYDDYILLPGEPL